MLTSPVLKARELDAQLVLWKGFSLEVSPGGHDLVGHPLKRPVRGHGDGVIATFSTLRSPHLSPNTLQGGEVGSQARAGLCFVPGASPLGEPLLAHAQSSRSFEDLESKSKMLSYGLAYQPACLGGALVPGLIMMG